MLERSYYEVMMLHPSATNEVISAVYRVLAKQYHPDHAGPAGSQKMAILNEAYAVLGNKEKRARYDEILMPVGGVRSAAHAGNRGPDDGASPASTSAHTSPAADRGRESMPGATNLKYTDGAWSVRPPTEPAPAAPVYGEAGAPPSYLRARGSVISFGRYRGWTISQVAAFDSNYVEWLSRTMAGRSYRDELQQALAQAHQQELTGRMKSARA